MLIGAIADDLTGGTDLSLTLRRAGMRVLQIVGVPAQDADFGDADAVVVSLKSRTIPVANAVRQSLSAAAALQRAGCAQFFFKYCSTFDSTDQGNIGPVIDALLEFLGETRTIACPAFPRNGRTVFKGHLFVDNQLLSDSSMRDHPLTPMHDANLVRVLGRQSKNEVSLLTQPVDISQIEKLVGIAIVDAITDDDLLAVAPLLSDLKLVTGGSGIALGLPGNFGLQPRCDQDRQLEHSPPGRAVILAGSCSTATRRQIAAAQLAGLPSLELTPHAIDAGEQTVEDVLAFVLQQPIDRPILVYSSADPEAVAMAQAEFGVDEAGAIIERFIAALAGRLVDAGVFRFIVAGGETSGAAVAGMGVTALQIGPEIDPGIPWTLADTPAGTLALALKSGNFGADDFFIKAWEQLA